MSLPLHKYAYEGNAELLSAAVKKTPKEELDAQDAHGEALQEKKKEDGKEQSTTLGSLRPLVSAPSWSLSSPFPTETLRHTT